MKISRILFCFGNTIGVLSILSIYFFIEGMFLWAFVLMAVNIVLGNIAGYLIKKEIERVFIPVVRPPSGYMNLK